MVEKYRVSGKRPIIDMINKALESCGVQIVRHPAISEAPFCYEILLPGGERLELVCYAFLANKYAQEGRPSDEHRFQVKYGSEFDRPHEIFLDPDRRAITLFIGVHVQAGIFIGVDPAMHNPTWFSSSVEFKTRHVTEAKARGWVTWERERSSARRRTGREAENFQTEILVAFSAENLLRYILLERLGTGLDAGERLLLAQRIGISDVKYTKKHPLEEQLGLSAREILDVVWGRFRLGVAVRGGVAEFHLGSYLRSRPEIDVVKSLDEDSRPDFEVMCKGRRILIECKNVLRETNSRGQARVDFQKTRAAKGNPCSRYYDRNAFDVVAACLHPITEKWEFRFAETKSMDQHTYCSGKLSPRVVVDDSRWVADILCLFA